MTENDIALIRQSWSAVLPIKAQAAGLFYGRLFEQNPALEPLFKGDMAEQGRKLMAMLNTIVMSLDRLDALVPTAQALARRHVAYGVQPAHYAAVGAALLWTLGAGLGTAFTPEVEQAWAGAYGLLSTAMIEAAPGSPGAT